MNRQEQINKVKEVIKNSELHMVTAREISEALSSSYMKSKMFLMELEIDGILKHKKMSKGEGYVYKWWYLPEEEDKTPKMIDENVGGGESERAIE